LVELWLQVISLKFVVRSLKGRCHGNQFLLALFTELSFGDIQQMALTSVKVVVHGQAAIGTAWRANIGLCSASSLFI